MALSPEDAAAADKCQPWGDASEYKTNDPTRDEMLAYLASLPFAGEADDFDKEEAIYWFAADYHSGQTSNLYSALSTTELVPAAARSGPEKGSMSEILYEALESEYGNAH